MLELREALAWLSAGRIEADDPRADATVVGGVSTDTRSVRPGELFVAIRGELHDAHDYVGRAIDAGAAAVLVERPVPDRRVPALVVPDCRRALGEIAAGWRRRFAPPVIAVTGSNGKTTTKEMIAAILAAHVGEDARLATRGNLNGDIGVPLTVLRMHAGHRAAVVELGMNHPGEIAWLASIAQATVALVLNAQREHQEFLRTVEATARENGASLAALPADGVAVFPGDDAHAPIWRELAGARARIEFGTAPGCAVSAAPDARPEGFEMRVDGAAIEVALAIDGAHSVRNALAAAACCSAIGVPPAAIAAGLAAFRPASGRLRRLVARTGAALIDDSYNANPDSVRAAIDVLAAQPAPRVLVLGDMGEVGEQGPRFHAEVGGYAKARGVQTLLAFGAASVGTAAAFGEGAEHFGTIEAVCDRAAALAAPGATVLVKGSRSMRMERVVQALAGSAASQGGHH
ncbi:MAG TPA: UDP-N-acetylmuramoyl-tripeptide--D-alanyl-D-alanine ligase [Burkholderiaceae bacterium]|nr:UDP-N-acetylmuramoyl-tripeptide--D-alanyl-D-alanine ligase [Burkholderiaceae bacterium]